MCARGHGEVGNEKGVLEVRSTSPNLRERRIFYQYTCPFTENMVTISGDVTVGRRLHLGGAQLMTAANYSKFRYLISVIVVSQLSQRQIPVVLSSDKIKELFIMFFTSLAGTLQRYTLFH